MNIKNIVFDVGRVLVHYDPAEIIDQLLPDTPYKDIYLNDLFESELWLRLDRGDLDGKAAAAEVLEKNTNNGISETDILTLINGFSNLLPVIQPNKDLFLKLKKSYPVYILSNFQTDPFKDLISREPFMNKADGIVVSAHINRVKPEKEIYEYLLNTYNLKAEESLFIDDLEVNINACQSVGMHGIVFKTPEQLLSDLKTYGISA